MYTVYVIKRKKIEVLNSTSSCKSNMKPKEDTILLKICKQSQLFISTYNAFCWLADQSFASVATSMSNYTHP